MRNMKALQEKKQTAERQISVASFRPTYTRQITFIIKKIRRSVPMAVRK